MSAKHRQFFPLIVAAILIRFIIMPFFFHPDIRDHYYDGSFLKSGIFNIYDYLVEHKNELSIAQEFSYFPLAYFSLGIFYFAVSLVLGSNFYLWLTTGQHEGEIFKYLFFMKLPYLFLDLLIGLLLMYFFDKEVEKRRALVFWLFNPFSLIIIYFYSNIDIIPVFLTVVSLLLIKKNKGLLAGMVLAVAASFKAYPILLLPSLFLTQEKFYKQALNLLVSIMVFVLIIAPFWGKAFIASAFSSGLTNRIFENGIDIGLPRKIPYFLIIYLSGFAYVYFRKRKESWIFFVLTTLMLVSMVEYHIQWLLWFIPFLIVLLVKYEKYLIYALIILILAFGYPLLLNDRFMSVALLSPISKVFLQVSYPYLFLQQFVKPELVRLILRILFFVTSFFLVFRVTLNEKK